ncbi:hypothetical protein MNV49_003619 [Pseudohyphozyma bogoriensis]|nr:hypothetical protein MNV49_003619 [Pseudohyphozyma bogoriensis]
MATIQSLPADILFKILEHAVEELTEPGLDDVLDRDDKRRSAILVSTALVARNWATPSQRILWKIVSLNGARSRTLFLKGNAAVAHRTSTLAVRQADRLMDVLEHVRGVDHLVLGEETTLDDRWLSIGCLMGLKRLSLIDVYDDCPFRGLLLASKIQQINVFCGTVFPGGALESIIPNCRHTLTDLRVDLGRDNGHLISFLPTVDLKIKRLTLRGQSFANQPALIRFYNSCTSLERLSLACTRDLLRAALKAQLPASHLRLIDIDGAEAFSELLCQLVTGPALPKLEKVQMRIEDSRENEEWSRLWEACRERGGIHLVLE